MMLGNLHHKEQQHKITKCGSQNEKKKFNSGGLENLVRSQARSDDFR